VFDSFFEVQNFAFPGTLYDLNQLCPTRGPVEGFVRSNLGFRSNISRLYILQTCP